MSTHDEIKRRLMARVQEGPAWAIDEVAHFQGDAKVAYDQTPATGTLKTAAFPPFGSGGDMDEGPGGAPGAKRNIPKDHPYEPSALKPMAQSLWAASVALGHALTAYRHLSRLKSSTISPDGMLGGRGYIMNVADLRKKLYDSCEALSAITDTLHDEINGPHWKPRLAQLDENEQEDVERFVEESKGILDDPEADAEEEEQEIEKSDEFEPTHQKEDASQLPGGSGGGAGGAGGASSGLQEKSDSPQQQMQKQANSSLPVETMPGGPRVEHLDREDGTPNPPGAWPEDDWGAPGEREYDYQSEWDNDLSERRAESGVPDAAIEDTPTEAWDFGIGYGARGEGAGGYENPSGEGDGTKGVFGPASGLPGTPAGSSGDTTPALDSAVGDKAAQGELPGDNDRPVARSDYYQGDRGNLVNTQSVLPGEATPSGEASPSMMNVDYSHEDLETPYVRYDYTTHDYRDDPLHNWPQSHLAGMNEDV